MSPAFGIGNSSGLQQTNIFILDNPTSSSATGTRSTNSTNGGLQSFLDQLQSALGNIAGAQSTSVSGTSLLPSTSAQTGTSSNAIVNSDNNQQTVGQVNSRHHGHHHHAQEGLTTADTSGSTNDSNLQSDASKLVTDIFSMLQQTSSKTSIGPTTSTTPTI